MFLTQVREHEKTLVHIQLALQFRSLYSVQIPVDGPNKMFGSTPLNNIIPFNFFFFFNNVSLVWPTSQAQSLFGFGFEFVFSITL